VSKFGSTQLRYLAPFISPAQFFKVDGVHLNQEAAIQFIQFILSGVDQVFPPTAPAPGTYSTPAPAVATDVPMQIVQGQNLPASSGYQSNATDARERKDFFKVKLQELVDEACPDVQPRPVVMDVYVNMRPGQDSPFLEGRMDSAASSSAFRSAASQLIKEESPKFKDLFVANAVTLSTRVRIEILRAISKALATEHTESYVQGFSSRPLLHYRTLEHVNYYVDGANRSYTFVEAVAKFGHLVQQFNLIQAYRRARPAFVGCLEQYFVILKESGPGDLSVTTGANQVPVGQFGHGPLTQGPHIRGRGSRSRSRGTSRGREMSTGQSSELMD